MDNRDLSVWSTRDRSEAEAVQCSDASGAVQNYYLAGSQVSFQNRPSSTIVRVSEEFLRKATIEGLVKLLDGRVVNVDGTIAGGKRWKFMRSPYGLDTVECSLVLLRSVAVDRHQNRLRTRLFITKTVRLTMPNGLAHDDLWCAVDTGSAIQSNRIDLFVGAGKASIKKLYDFGISHLRPLAVDTRGTITMLLRADHPLLAILQKSGAEHCRHKWVDLFSGEIGIDGANAPRHIRGGVPLMPTFRTIDPSLTWP